MSLLAFSKYQTIKTSWPDEGKVILASFNEREVIVYQAFRPTIADAAVADQRFGGGGYSLTRMSWVKPNFLWMMYRADWCRREVHQARVLAITIRRAFFDELLRSAVRSSFGDPYSDRVVWKHAIKTSDVRLQWDPDHHLKGAKLTRRAVQLGLRGETLRRFAEEECVAIEDITPFVHAQRDRDLSQLEVPTERVYPVVDKTARVALAMPLA